MDRPRQLRVAGRGARRTPGAAVEEVVGRDEPDVSACGVPDLGRDVGPEVRADDFVLRAFEGFGDRLLETLLGPFARALGT